MEEAISKIIGIVFVAVLISAMVAPFFVRKNQNNNGG